VPLGCISCPLEGLQTYRLQACHCRAKNYFRQGVTDYWNSHLENAALLHVHGRSRHSRRSFGLGADELVIG